MKILNLLSIIPLTLIAIPQTVNAQTGITGIRPIGFEKVKMDDAFWKPRMDKVSTVTLQACINYTEFKTARIRNFEHAAAKTGKHEGIYYDDSDVYKALEAMSYSLQNHPDSSMEKKADEWINKIARAQMPDGYLDTYFQLRDPTKRWTDMEKHEDYNAGHLIEAAVAYYHATGKRVLLDVAIRLANQIDSTFRLAGRNWVSGHEEIELALMKLYHLTLNDRYLKLAHWYLEERGHGYGSSPVWTSANSHEYYQDDKTVKNADKIKGHAVRAMYLYTGTADVAAVIHDPEYVKAMERVWEDVVYRNMYVTGGIGSSGSNEGFTEDYDLPNIDAYCETCASVGMVLWNQRMNLLTGDSKYIDVLERSLYNAALDGLSLKGDLFFYGNPLASPGQYARSEWFGTACCPANIARLVSSIGNYVYNQTDKAVWINLYAGNKTELMLNKNRVGIEQVTNYPWDGKILININPDIKSKWDLNLRIPCWAQGNPVPGDLYHFVNPVISGFKLQVNGKDVAYRMEKGYAVISLEWKKGDQVTLSLPMPVNLVAANPKVKADQGRVAIQRGPLIYCVEGSDNQGQAWNLLVPDAVDFTSRFDPELLGGVVQIQAQMTVLKPGNDGVTVVATKQNISAIPYFVWCNRAADPMQVWIPQKINDLKINY